jgi:hypothetical protein
MMKGTKEQDHFHPVNLPEINVINQIGNIVTKEKEKGTNVTIINVL